MNKRDYRAWYGLGQTYEILKMPFYSLYYYKQAHLFRCRLFLGGKGGDRGGGGERRRGGREGEEGRWGEGGRKGEEGRGGGGEEGRGEGGEKGRGGKGGRRGKGLGRVGLNKFVLG